MRAFTKTEINKAGHLMIERNNHPVRPEVVDAFATAHEWRDGHLLPMRALRQELKAISAKAGVTGLTSGRLKRFQSIRAKLRRLPLNLYQLQDLAGVRIIVENIAAVEPILEKYRGGASKHEVLRETDYISAPKTGGYRSAHFIVKYIGDPHKTAGNRLTGEIQIRTRLQHAWATAVEAVGAVRNEELKSGLGDPRWLRFFEIMSGEFAVEEKQPIGPNISENRKERRDELLTLEAELDAVVTLESYRRAIASVEQFSRIQGSSFLLSFNSVTHAINVTANRAFSGMSAEYMEAERNEANNAVFVEVDRVGELVSAYPNYFLDVQIFTERLRALATVGKIKPHRARPLTSDEWFAEWVAGSKRR